MKGLVAVVAILGAGVFGACSKQSSPITREVTMVPAVVGEKTALYEVVAPNTLRLPPGVRFEVADGPCGKNSAIVLLRPNGETGGYMACGIPHILPHMRTCADDRRREVGCVIICRRRSLDPEAWWPSG
jgi:hypothetical protein